jgi:hypothetical protein
MPTACIMVVIAINGRPKKVIIGRVPAPVPRRIGGPGVAPHKKPVLPCELHMGVALDNTDP